MQSEILAALIGGGAGLSTGVIGSLVAPWAQWGVEKLRLKRAGRVSRIDEWRQGIKSITDALHKSEQMLRLQNHPQWEDEAGSEEAWAALGESVILSQQGWYHTLEPHLTDKELGLVNSREREVEEQNGYVSPDGVAKYLVPVLSRCVTRMEKEWKLT